ncbi:Ctf8 [Caenorhabditis elegans]|uniref:Ctf8 n=1 Tax=Caenorhabditis elegans TaxID=6239 RepID=Q22664_CAEEL|nr:Ctf8 [Caenorhabditis elegans]CAA99922.2 Ctf8 [Caenorhabditis elegans]|eukprot:NP_492190.2 Chromosome Transmission Fidelity factor homolog [Caenorhabditis elegans]
MQIKLIPTLEGTPEWMAIELHGAISPQDDGSFDSKTLGTICWGDHNNVYMVIGNQTLEGKISKIDRPLLVIQKSDKNHQENGEKNATVNAVIRKKLVFKTRPRPLVLSTVV